MPNRAKGSSRVWVYLWLPRSRTVTVTIGYFCVEVRHCLTETGYICGNTSNMSSPKGMATYTNNCVIYLSCYFCCQDLSALTVTVRTKWATTAKYTVKRTESWPPNRGIKTWILCTVGQKANMCILFHKICITNKNKCDKVTFISLCFDIAGWMILRMG